MSWTYQLGPLDSERFRASHVDAIVATTVESVACSRTDLTGLDLSREITERVKAAVVEQGNVPRHRIAVQCVVSRDEGQSVQVASKSLWDSSTDNYSSFTHKRDSDGTVISVFIFCVYKE